MLRVNSDLHRNRFKHSLAILAILEPILLYRGSKCKQTKQKASEDSLRTHIFTFLCDYCERFFFFLSIFKQSKINMCYYRLQFVTETQIHSIKHRAEGRTMQIIRFFQSFARRYMYNNLGTDIQILQSWLAGWCMFYVTLRLT